MEKIDLRKQYKDLYTPSKKEFSLIEVPHLQYLMIEGHGDPHTLKAYRQAIQTLYDLTYTLKFGLKKSQGIDYTVMGLEGLWWNVRYEQFFDGKKGRMTLDCRDPATGFHHPELFEAARREVIAKGKGPLAKETRPEYYDEGLSAQIMYIGAYDDGPPTIACMHAFIQEHDYVRSGKHHEIYLSDLRRVSPEKNRTILRQPVKKA